MQKFSDFAKEKALDGGKARIDDILGKEIIVLAYHVGASRYKQGGNSSYLKLQFELDGKRRVLFTGSGVLIRQCEQYGEQMPFAASIVKSGKYYSFQ